MINEHIQPKTGIVKIVENGCLNVQLCKPDPECAHAVFLGADCGLGMIADEGSWLSKLVVEL